MFPVYGLAEATVAVTFPPLGQAPGIEWIDRARLAGAGRAVPTEPTAAAARGVVCVGRPVPGLEVRIDGDPAPGQIGEILVRGASVMREYYRAPAATEERLAAGWLRTGDLGYLRDGGLYVTGRRKQMIVVNGVNHYPEDVEAVARGAPGLHRQRCIAFGLEGLERILLLAEAHSTDPVETAILAARLYRCITTSLELYDVGVHVVRKNTLRRTTSGKYQRLLMRDLLTRGALSRSVLASYPPPAEPGAHATADVAAAEVLR
jgi:acyl-CoA synthetase (AMP-forming)/AMP-acid ligase II